MPFVCECTNPIALTVGAHPCDTSAYVTILHPRRLAWLNAGISGVIPPGSALPGQVVASAGIPSVLGAGTNEDVALIVAKSQVLLLSQGPMIRVFDEVGSQTMTVRIRAAQILWSVGFYRAASTLTASPWVTQTSPLRGSAAAQTGLEPTGMDSTSKFVPPSMTSTVPSKNVGT